MRTDAEKIGAIIEVDEDIALTPFIETANALVTECCEENEEADYDDTRLELIERWLAAHFYAVRDPRTTSEAAGISQSFESAVGLGFNVSKYGQMALRLDTAGGLAALERRVLDGKRNRAPTVTYLGRRRHYHHHTHDESCNP